MRKGDFAKLLESVRQAGRIRRGEMAPSRVTTVRAADVKTVRTGLGKTQTEFALMIGVSPAALRNWDIPPGPAKAVWLSQ